MTATTQANMNPGTTKTLTVEFSHKDRVTYFEKLLLRKYKDSPVVPSQPNGDAEHDAPLELEPGEEDVKVPAISQYNVFYDAEPMEFDSGNIQTDPFDDFNFCTAPSGVAVEELSSSNDDQLTSTESGVAVAPVESVTETSTEPSTEEVSVEICKSEGGSQKPTVSNSGDVMLSKGKKCRQKKARKQKQPLSDKRNIQDSEQPNLSSSVKAAWASCTRSDHNNRQMASFFLHGVKPTGGQQEEEERLPEPPSLQDTSQFKLGSAVWLPSSSTQPTEPETALDMDATSPPLPPPSRTGTRDSYYDDDTDSDSDDAGGDRAAFIISRLDVGVVRDSIQGLEERPGSSYRELEEEEEKMERDKADCECLDDLAWELASTVECEGRLTRCEGELDQEQGADNSATPVSEQPKEERNTDMEELDMSKVISEFELYQRGLMEEDCDEQQ